MKLFIILLSYISAVYAFTNGTLLPPYLCGFPNDGFPKSLGGVLQYFKVPGAALTVANFHNQNSTVPQTGVITVNKTTGLIDTITSSEIVNFNLVSSTNTPIDGAIVYAQDQLGNRLGQFTLFGTHMQPFPACGFGDVGIVHNQVLSDTPIYTRIQWKAPVFNVYGGVTKIIFKGLAVTDAGFGFHETTFNFVNY